MKLTTFLLIVSLLQVQASTYSQKTRLSLDFENASISQVLDRIEKISKFRFLFESDEIDLNRKISLKVHKKKIFDVLPLILRGTEVDYKIRGRQVILTKKELGVLLPEVNVPGSVPLNDMVQQSISGTVSDENGQPLPGASIVEKGTTNGTQTDFDGNFSINVSDQNAILIVSYIGFATQEIPVNNQDTINIALVESTSSLDEVVVIGYGATVSKKDATGAVASAELERALETPNVSVIQALQGAVAGLNIGAVTVAGENPTLSVRGQSTLNGVDENGRSTANEDNAPLIVLDGIIYRGSLVDLNTSDIQSIDILKDASSAAIYGSQASNGVIVITSKSGGVSSKPIINYTSSYSIQTPANDVRPMQSAEYAEFYPDIFWAEGSKLAPDFIQDNPDYDFTPNLKTNFLNEGFRNGVDTNWWDLLTRNGTVNTHNLSVRGRSERTGYFLSAGITDQNGILLNDDYTRYNFRVNLDVNINDWLKIGTQTFAVVSDFSGANASAEAIFRLQPWAPIRDDNGEFITNPVDQLNPFLTNQQEDSDIRLNLSSTIYADVKLPLEGLTYRMNYSNAYRTINQSNFNAFGADFTGLGSKDHFINWDWTFDNIVSYNRTFNENHNLGVTLLYGVEKRHLSGTETQASNFDVDVLGFNRLQAGDPTLNEILTTKEEESSIYQMARVIYDFKKKYFFTGTLRRDGFSGFGANEKIGVFPTAAVGWTVTEESFVNESSWLNFLKLRASYGQSGRRGVSRLQTFARVESEPAVVFGDGGSPTQGIAIVSLANPALTWETTTGSNFGVDFSILNSRISGSIEYYDNKTENILFDIALPEITGFDRITSNIAEVQNNGLEVVLRANILDGKDFSWNTSIDFNRVRNEITSILGPDNDENGDGREDDLIGNGLFIGEPQNSIFNYDIIGMWQLADEANGNLPDGFFPGTYKLRDINGDGMISSLDDRRVIGYEDPSFRIGIANTFRYKDFTLYAFINSIQGGNDFYLGDDGFHSVREQLSFENIPSGGFDYWLPENPNARYRRLDTPSQFGAQLSNPNGAKPYSSRSFVRLQDVSLSYNLPGPMLDVLGIRTAKIFVSGKNLYTWTDWQGWDPETGAGFGAGAGLPVLKSYSLGLNVEF
ncbi:TonB-dependent receptor [Ulvibacterium sp.]|uniref:TonB-dependent receptor n=1 Tax=Ulvibacterium sp. TaxID=2665914 RepID=UPI003BA915FA